jgi:hypothetical protein
MALIRIAAALVLVLVLALALQLSAAAPPDRCTHVCGHMRVPYPFGIGPPDAGCYLPGLNLTCDTSRRGAPRLLIGAGAGAVGLQVVDIFLHNSTLRVVQSGDVAIGANGRGLFNGDLRDHGPYKLLSSENELVVTGCNVMATLLDRNSSIVMSACASFCQDPNGPYVTAMDMGSCKEPVVGTRDEVAGYVQLTRFSQNATMDEERQRTQVFVAENGWFDRHLNASLAGASLVEGAMSAVPLLLQWDVVDLERGRPPPNEFDKWFSGCPTDLALKICRSGNSTCYQSGGYSCSCSEGYDGNPYVNGTEGCHGNQLIISTHISQCNLLTHSSLLSTYVLFWVYTQISTSVSGQRTIGALENALIPSVRSNAGARQGPLATTVSPMAASISTTDTEVSTSQPHY